TLQSAINSLPDGGIVQFRAGDIDMTEQIFIRGKRLEFVGAGSGLNKRGRLTRLIGTPPSPVVDEAGNLILRAEAVTGMFNLIAAQVVFRDVMITGTNAAAVIHDDEAGNSAPAIFQDMVIDGSGRGILSLGSGTLTIKDTVIQNTLWHGVSMKAPFHGELTIPNLILDDSKILHSVCGGTYFENTTVFLSDVTVIGALCGGIVGYKSTGVILDSLLLDNYKAGIILVEATGSPLIRDNTIVHTLPTLSLQNWGDGVSIFSSPDVFLDRNTIQDSARAGVGIYGSGVSLQDNTMTCSAFDIDVETHNSIPPNPQDLGGNQCGCGDPLGECEAVSSQLVPDLGNLAP
ncbi:MAG TPA: right-handed parallel beta-helix repeat-containing protein, partial [Candidatus Binatia bacterium]|nr:right-handed parallel beta-helix repeat-containing protein [Candidatus Binatia bacterium]